MTSFSIERNSASERSKAVVAAGREAAVETTDTDTRGTAELPAGENPAHEPPAGVPSVVEIPRVRLVAAYCSRFMPPYTGRSTIVGANIALAVAFAATRTVARPADSPTHRVDPVVNLPPCPTS